MPGLTTQGSGRSTAQAFSQSQVLVPVGRRSPGTLDAAAALSPLASEGLGNLPGVNAPKVRQEEPATPRCGASVPRLRIERWH
jgi:hypothetical protein